MDGQMGEAQAVLYVRGDTGVAGLVYLSECMVAMDGGVAALVAGCFNQYFDGTFSCIRWRYVAG